MQNDPAMRSVQVEVATTLFKQRWVYFSKNYDVDLLQLPENLRGGIFVWTMDIRHQGRGTYRAMQAAIKSGDPIVNLAAIGSAAAGPARIRTVADGVARLPARLDWGWLQ
jgi:hypothetical protein